MRIQAIHAALTASDTATAEQFHAVLFRPRHRRQTKGDLVRRRDVPSADGQIFRDPKNAEHSRGTIVVPSMEESRDALGRLGFSLRDERESDFGKITQIDDPDGNPITLAEPPSKPIAR